MCRLGATQPAPHTHAYLGGCRHRTKTSKQNLFRLTRFYVNHRETNHKLSERDPIILDFERAAPNIYLEIPPGSGWYGINHAHHTEEMCIRIQTRSGVWFWNSTWTGGRPSSWGPQRPGEWLQFGRQGSPVSEATVEIIGSKNTRKFYHLVASVEQDAELYFSLCTTQLWVKGLYALTRLVPSAKTWLVHCVLWIQLRMIFHRNDYWEYHGTCYFFQYFYWFDPPQWVDDFEDWSTWASSHVAQFINYWASQLLLGMNETYPEYAFEEDESHSKA